MKIIAIEKLKAIIEDESRSVTEQMHFSDTFASACFLHAEGHQLAGQKLINELFDLLGRNRRKTYFHALLDTLSGNEARYALGVRAHNEIRSLFDAGRSALEP